jgi:hypothetical protein
VLRSFGLEWIFIGRLPFDGALTLESLRYSIVSARQDADKRRTNLQGRWTSAKNGRQCAARDACTDDHDFGFAIHNAPFQHTAHGHKYTGEC